MIIFACIFVAAIGLAFGLRGLRALAGVFLVCCVLVVVGIGWLFATEQARSDAFLCEQYARDVKYGLRPSAVPLKYRHCLE